MNLNISQRLFLNSLPLIFPVIYLLNGIYSAKEQFIDAAQNELSGAPVVIEATERMASYALKPSKASHDGLLQELKRIDETSEKSGLILDPDVDTFFMMDAFCLQIPQIILRLHKITQDLQDAHGAPTPEQMSRISGEIAVYNILLGNLNQDIQKSIRSARRPISFSVPPAELIASLSSLNDLAHRELTLTGGNPDDISKFREKIFPSF